MIFFDLSWILNVIVAAKPARYCYEVDNFLNYQIENQESDR